MINKDIFSIWLNDNEKFPDLINRCIKSQKISGYKHHLITLKNYDISSNYVKKAIECKNWVKAVDFLRCYYIHKYGGIYVDADVEIIKNKTFDNILDNKLFVCREENGFLANSVIGAEKNNYIIKEFLDYVENNCDPTDKNIFQDGMERFTIILSKYLKDIKIYTSDYFLPYNHQNGITTMTENTITYHYFMKSWLNI
ncbi:MAG: capsular polysaccharide synthesis protein [Clostridia bacterium]|nr:capsular polysaccharide synthesis protein [Clostridia bacterium]